MLRVYEDKINMLEKLVIDNDARAENRAVEREIKALEREHRSMALYKEVSNDLNTCTRSI